jgi:MFS transporter, DHA3 family, tetracycline resistance protein
LSIRSKDPTFVYLVLQAGWSVFFSVLATTNLVYQVEVAHLDPLRLLLIGTVLELTCFVFQVPTGAFADAISRRLAVALGCGLVGAGFILEGLVPQFAAIATAQVVWGVRATLSDSADDAWITDELGVDVASGLFLRASQLGQASGLLGILIGVGLATIRLNLPIVVGGVLFVLLGLYLFFAMSETSYQAIPRERHHPLTDMFLGIRRSLATVRGSRLIVIILAITVVWGPSGEGIDRLNQVHFFKDIGLPNFAGLSPVLWFGVISGGSTLIGIATTRIIRRRLDLRDQRQVTRLLFAATAARALMAAGFALATNLGVAITFFGMASAMRQAFGPVQRAWLNRTLDSANRATLLSIDGQADALGQIAGGPMIGAIGSGVSIRAALTGERSAARRRAAAACASDHRNVASAAYGDTFCRNGNRPIVVRK